MDTSDRFWQMVEQHLIDAGFTERQAREINYIMSTILPRTVLEMVDEHAEKIAANLQRDMNNRFDDQNNRQAEFKSDIKSRFDDQNSRIADMLGKIRWKFSATFTVLGFAVTLIITALKAFGII